MRPAATAAAVTSAALLTLFATTLRFSTLTARLNSVVAAVTAAMAPTLAADLPAFSATCPARRAVLLTLPFMSPLAGLPIQHRTTSHTHHGEAGSRGNHRNRSRMHTEQDREQERP